EHEGDEIEHEPSAPADHERRGEQHQNVAVGRQRQPEGEHLRAQRDQEGDRREQGGAAVDVLSRWAPALALAGACVLAVAMRLPFIHAPLTADEGGYGEVARLWSKGASLYGQAGGDRPQGLLLVFRGILHIDGGSAEAIRGAAAAVGALVVAAVYALASRTVGRIPAIAAALLLATLGASPFIESFTLSGEL